jgi:hypothetical protein
VLLSFIEQYLDAARALTAKAVGNPTPRPVGTTYAAGGAREQRFHVDGLPLGTRGGAVFEHYFPSDGDSSWCFEMSWSSRSRGPSNTAVFT